MSQELAIFYLLFGCILLIVGWRLFWVFVGIAGFVAGLDFAQYAFSGQPQLIMLIAAVCCALIGIVLALFFQKIVIILAGAVAGGAIALHWMSFFISYDPTSLLHWTVLGIGAVLGGILMAIGFNLALVIISSLLGSLLIVSVLPVDGTLKLIIAVFLVIFGICTQNVFSKSNKKSKTQPKPSK